MGDAEFRARLAQIMERFGSVAEMARAVGLSDNAIYKWLKGTGQPSVANLIALARAANVSLEWLATGEEPAQKPGAADDGHHPPNFIFMPRNQLRQRGGKRGASSRNEQVVDHLAFRTDWAARYLRVEPRDLILIEAAGDAMAPAIASGDLVLVDMGRPRFIQEGIYLLKHAGGISLKRLELRPDGKVLLCNDNPVYPALTAERQDVAILGRAIWSGGRI